MSELITSRVTIVWLMLVLATAISWGATHDVGDIGVRAATVAALIMAFVKVRFVVLDFMELRTAPWLYRMFFEAWIVVIGAALILIVGAA